jgi:hypothetical protein
MTTPANGTRTTIVIRKGGSGKVTAIIPAYWFNGLKVCVPKKEDDE